MKIEFPSNTSEEWRQNTLEFGSALDVQKFFGIGLNEAYDGNISFEFKLSALPSGRFRLIFKFVNAGAFKATIFLDGKIVPYRVQKEENSITISVDGSGSHHSNMMGQFIVENYTNTEYRPFLLIKSELRSGAHASWPIVENLDPAANYRFMLAKFLICVCIGLSTFILAKEISSLSGVFSATVAGFASLLGFVASGPISIFRTGWLHVHVERTLRQLSARKWLLPSIIMVFVSLTLYSYGIVECLYFKDRYNFYVEKFASERLAEDAAKAFSIFPNRIEIHYLVSKHVDDIRKEKGGKQIFTSEYLREISFNDWKAAPKEASFLPWLRRFCGCVEKQNKADPILETALIAPDATAHDGTGQNYTEVAISKLQKIKSKNVSELYILILQSTLLNEAPEPKFISSLSSKSLENYPDPRAREMTFEALSLLSMIPIENCAFDAVKPDLAQIDEAIQQMQRLVSLRGELAGSFPEWVRPPEKMGVFSMFMTVFGTPPNKTHDLSSWRAKAECTEIFNAFEAHFSDKKFEKWRLRENWLTGTIFERKYRGTEGFKAFAADSLENGWRF